MSQHTVDPRWKINPILNDESAPGELLKSLFGYNSNPALTEGAGLRRVPGQYWVIAAAQTHPSPARRGHCIAIPTAGIGP